MCSFKSAAVVWCLIPPDSSLPCHGLCNTLRVLKIACLSVLVFSLSFAQQPFVDLVHHSGTTATIETVSVFTIHYLLQRIQVVSAQSEGTRGLFQLRLCVRPLHVIINCLARGKAKAMEGNQESDLPFTVLWTVLWQLWASLPLGGHQAHVLLRARRSGADPRCCCEVCLATACDPAGSESLSDENREARSCVVATMLHDWKHMSCTVVCPAPHTAPFVAVSAGGANWGHEWVLRVSVIHSKLRSPNENI